MPELGVKGQPLYPSAVVMRRRRFPRELPCRARLCRWLPGDRGPTRQWASVPGAPVSAWSWVPPQIWTCPRCSTTLLVRELGVRCSRCGYHEDE